MKNRMSDLNNHLFEQMERLNDEALTGEALEAEIKRASAMVNVADQITENSKTMLVAARLYADKGPSILPHLPMIGKAET